MKVFLSKHEIEALNKEDYYVVRDYGCKESILTELISIKIYNLIKNNLNIDNDYLNRVFSLGSFCPDINLSDYDIKDVDIMIKFKDNILSGFMSQKEKHSKETFITIVELCDNLISSTNEKSYDVLPKPAIITNLLNSSNIEYISSLYRIAKEKIYERFREEFNDMFANNLFIASRLRKESFDNISEEERETLLKTTFSGYYSTSEYIHKLSGKHIPDLFENFVSKMLDELKDKMSIDIANIEKLYERASSCANNLIIDFLYSPVQNYDLFNPDLKMIDLFFVKDELDVINKKKYELENKQKFLQFKIDKFNDLIKGLRLEIQKVCPPSMQQRTFKISYANTKGIRCCRISDIGRTLKFNENVFYVKCLCFTEMDYSISYLGNLLHLNNTLNLKITYKGKTIYTIPEELKNKLLAAQKEVLDIIPIKYRDKLYLE